ncbi:MAG: FHA domain-containing protein [Acidobacteria bacterium]|nr:FHA domain-containing protein [Acidobacteriota bacterium]
MVSDVFSNRPVRLRDYRYRGEHLSLVLTFIVLAGLFALIMLFFPRTWSATLNTLIITLAGLGVFVITVKLQQRAAFGTLVRVGPRQFPELNELALNSADNLSSPPVPVYVKRASEMNVYTLGFWQQPIIVLTSSLVDQMEADNLQFFIGREIGHVQAGHTWLRTLLKPLGAGVPVVGRLLNSVIFGDWINRAEFTADRAGLIACGSLTTAVSTMLKFGIGVRLYEKLDIREFLEQINDVRNVSGHLTEIVAEQPYLTQRIRSLIRYALSDQFRDIAPEDHRHTRILLHIPEAFVSASIDLGDLGLASLKEALESKPEPDARQMIELGAITVSDHIDLTTADQNAPDPHLTLVSSESGVAYILCRQSTRIGRNHDNDLVLDNERVSRYHAEIFRAGDQIKIVDKDSRNGVWVNGRKIKQPTPIKSGDHIRIGRQEYTFVEKAS